MKKIGLLYLSAFIFLGLCSCSAKTKTLIMAEVNPPDTIAGRMDLAFKTKVEELSKGKIIINLQTSSVLGNEEEVMQTIANKGPIDITRISTTVLTAYGAEKSCLLSIPYTFIDKEHFWTFANSDVAKEILHEPYEKNMPFRGLFFGEEGFRNFFAIEPVHSINEMKGKFVRINNDEVMKTLVSSLGATPTLIGFANLYSALQIGTAQVAEQPIVNYYSNSFNIVAPNLILDGHTLGITEVVISATTWNSLSSKEKTILEEAGRFASDYCRQISQEVEEETLAKLKQENVNIIEVNKDEWKDACSQMIEHYSSINPDLYKVIIDFKNK